MGVSPRTLLAAVAAATCTVGAAVDFVRFAGTVEGFSFEDADVWRKSQPQSLLALGPPYPQLVRHTDILDNNEFEERDSSKAGVFRSPWGPMIWLQSWWEKLYNAHNSTTVEAAEEAEEEKLVTDPKSAAAGLAVVTAQYPMMSLNFSSWGPPLWHTDLPQSPIEVVKKYLETPQHKVAFLAVMIVALLALEAFVVQSYCSKFVTPILWIGVGMLFSIMWMHATGKEGYGNWLTGYFYEWIFQVDDLFVFHLIFLQYQLPRDLTSRALFLCLGGQCAARFLYYLGLAHLIRTMTFVHYLAGGALVFGGALTVVESSGVRAAAADHSGPSLSPVAMLRNLGGKRWEPFVSRLESSLLASPVVSCVTTMLFADIVLGADCAITKIEEIGNPLSNLSSSTLALFGINASYYVIAHMADNFVYMQPSIGLILMFVGGELLILNWVQLGTYVSLAVIASILMVAVALSVLRMVWLERVQASRRLMEALTFHTEEAVSQECAGHTATDIHIAAKAKDFAKA